MARLMPCFISLPLVTRTRVLRRQPCYKAETVHYTARAKLGGTYGDGTIFRVAPPSPPQLGSPKIFPDGSFRFSLVAPAGQSCRIDVSTNLLDWSALTNITCGTNAVQVIDPGTTNTTRRFYRSMSPR